MSVTPQANRLRLFGQPTAKKPRFSLTPHDIRHTILHEQAALLLLLPPPDQPRDLQAPWLPSTVGGLNGIPRTSVGRQLPELSVYCFFNRSHCPRGRRGEQATRVWVSRRDCNAMRRCAKSIDFMTGYETSGEARQINGLL